MQPQPPHLPGVGTDSPIPAVTHAGPAHALPSWALAQPLLCRHSSVPRYPPGQGVQPHTAPGTTWLPSAPWAQPQALPGPFCPMGTAPHNPGHSLFHPALPHGHSAVWSRAQPALSLSAPRAQPDTSHGHSLPHLHLPHEQSLPCAPSIPWAQNAPSHGRASSPWVQLCPVPVCPAGAACPVPPPHTRGTTGPTGAACHIPPPQGHSAHCGASPSQGTQGACGCRCSPHLGARPPQGAHGRGSASAIGPVAPSSHPPGPVCRGAGVGCGAATRGSAPQSCVPGGSQLPTWEERGEIWGAVAGDIGEGGPRGGGGGGGGRRWPTVSCLYERTVQTTC